MHTLLSLTINSLALNNTIREIPSISFIIIDLFGAQISCAKTLFHRIINNFWQIHTENLHAIIAIGNIIIIIIIIIARPRVVPIDPTMGALSCRFSHHCSLFQKRELQNERNLYLWPCKDVPPKDYIYIYIYTHTILFSDFLVRTTLVCQCDCFFPYFS